MTLSDLAALGSFVSGVAVLVTLGFLVLQIRQSNRNQRSLMQQQRSARNVQILLSMTNPFMGNLVAKGHADCDSLKEDEIWSFYGMAGAVFWSYEDSYMQFHAGTLDQESWMSDIATIRRLLGQPAYRVVWKLARDGMSGSYRDFLDGVMDEMKNSAAPTLSQAWQAAVKEELG